MGSAKKYIDLYLDFFLFMMGLLALFSGFNRVYAFQDNTLLSLTDNGLVYIQNETISEIDGADIVPLLLAEKNVPVIFNDVVYEKQEVETLLAVIDTSETYTVKRVYDTGKTNAPSEIHLHKREGN